MLGNHDPIATVAVKDLDKARKFYEGTLGLKLVHTEEGGALTFKSGKTELLVYVSQFAGTNKATAATWNVRDLETLIADLKGNGVTFEHYDMPETTRKGDVHYSGRLKVAWFKDPDGNIHALVSE
jgi:catechol 2,3-dioxygenase-like lactoylglutathione lyase family enzyme